MKIQKLYYFIINLMTAIMILFAPSGLKAQDPVASCQVILANDQVIDQSHYAFDVFIKSTNDAGYPTGFPYANAQFRVDFNALIRNTGLSTNARIQGKLIAGSSELTNTSQQANAVTNPTATQSYIRIPGRLPVLYSESSIISNIGNGTKIFRMMAVSRDTVAHSYLPFTTNEMANLALSFATPGGVQVYYCGSDDLPYLCSPMTLANSLSNPILVPPVAPPVAYNVTGGGSYCQGSGGLPVGLDNSETDVIYELWKNAVATGTTVPGVTGSPIDFGNQLAGTYTIKGTNAGGTTQMSGSAILTEIPLVTPSFDAIGPLCQGSVPTALPATSLNGITGTWSPAVISTSATGTTVYTFIPDPGQCAVTTTLSITVNVVIDPSFAVLGPYCVGDTPDLLPGTSLNGVTGTWNPEVISTTSAGSTIYTFTPSGGQCANSATMTILVNSVIVPTFTVLGPYCLGDSPDILPGTSLNGVAGTWNPAVINTSSAGITVYTFTPIAGVCVTSATMSVTVNAPTVPSFAAMGPYCLNAVAPALPGTSMNGITGTWNPAVIVTTSAGITTYTFTPDAGQCATSTTLDISVVSDVVPTFTAIGPLCQESVPPTLPGTSNNSITGTWSPAVITTSIPGTSTYTFTPDAGQCAVSATMDITVNVVLDPSFTLLGPYCQGDIADVLQGTSINGVTGTWNPAVINTAIAGTTVYTFTPSVGQCANVATMSVVVYPTVTPTFTALGPYCLGDIPGLLQGTSLNGVTGTWSPAIINTSVPGSSDYTFTPDAGQCSPGVVMTIAVNSPDVPLFNPMGPYCQFTSATVLPATSLNGVTGTWTPSIVVTTIPGTTTYFFTPDAGQCALPASLDITIVTEITPTFTQIGPLCQYSLPPALPALSNNGITGSWSPSTINTSVPGTAIYTFTADPGQCGVTVTMSITIDPEIVPSFAQLGPYCQGDFPGILPVSSINGINGIWSPAVVSTSTPGSTLYTFTPDPGPCAAIVTMTVVVNALVTPSFAAFGPYCQGDIPALLSGTSLNGISGIWNPATISTTSPGTTNYTFTPDAGQCASALIVPVIVNATVTPTFIALGPYCQGSTPETLPGTSLNGITGIWNPATISTTAPGTTVYTFTPAAGQCATTVAMSVTVNAPVTPTFTALGPYCQGSTPGTLPGTSLNGITGTWNPATISTATPGNTVYTFTPTTGQCATTASMTVTVTAQTVPTFNALGPYCLGATPGILPTTSLNGITGTWSPAVINTSSVGTFVYTFTPTTGQCASITTMSVIVYPLLTPSVSIAANASAVCEGTIVTFFAMPINGGSAPVFNWYVNSTLVATGLSYYTYVPEDGDNVYATMISNAPCTSTTPVVSNTVTMKVYNLPVPVINGQAVTCAAPATSVYSTLAGMTNYTWSVSAGGSIIAGSGTNNITVQWSVAGVQSVTLNYVDAHGCTAAYPTLFPVTVNPTPVTPVITQHGDTLRSSAVSGNQWYKDGALIQGATGQEYVVMTNGTYHVVVTLNGCISQLSNSIVMLHVNVEPTTSRMIVDIYPNPNYGEFDLKVDNVADGNYSIVICNNLGEAVWKSDDIIIKGSYLQHFNFSEKPAGIYFFSFRNKSISVVKKVILLDQ